MKLHTALIAGVMYETNDASLISAAKQCGPGFSAKIAKRDGKIWRIMSEEEMPLDVRIRTGKRPS